MNLIGAPGELLKTLEFLVNEFKNERHERKYCLDLKVDHRSNGMFVHQSEYIEKILKRFHMDITP